MSIKPFLPKRSLLSPKWSQHLCVFVGGLFFLGLAFLSLQQLASLAQRRPSYAAARPPSINSINPNSGLITGGYSVTISGVNLDGEPLVSNLITGDDFTCTYYDDNHYPMYCWGNNAHGQLGNNGVASIFPEHAVVDSKNYYGNHSAIGQHYCVYSAADQHVYCWGDNTHGQLGDGTNTNRLVPTPVANIGGSSSIVISDDGVVSGDRHGCALSKNGKIYCWGDNTQGQLGTGDNVNSNVPVLVNSSLEFTNVYAGLNHTCARATDSKLYCWGDNTQGQLGTGDNVNSNVPVAVNTALVFDSFSFKAGGNHNCAFSEADSKLYCWGDNAHGQLGTGDNVNSNVPVAVNTTKTFSTVGVGKRHTCAVENRLVGDAYLYCWGDNTQGQLGTGDNVNSNVPALVFNADKIFTNSKVFFGERQCTQLAGNDSEVTCIVPEGAAVGPVDVTIYAREYNYSAVDGFTYLPVNAANIPVITSITPNQGPIAGGTSITIIGENLKSPTSATTVTIGGNNCTNIVVNATGTTITCTTPPGASAGAAPVVVAHDGGSASDSYTYLSPLGPVITSITPNQGPIAGGTSITIIGENLKSPTSATTVTIGGNNCTNIVVNATGTTITCTTPPGASAGSVNVVIAHDGGNHTTPDGFNYTDGSLSLNILGGSEQWFNTTRVATLQAQATIYPMVALRHRLDNPAHTVTNPGGSPPQYLCNQGTSVAINAGNQYDITHQIADMPGSQGKHTLYACVQQQDTKHVLIAAANFNYDSLPLQCSFAPPVVDPSATHSAIFSLTCSDPGVVGTTASGPCPTVDPGNPLLACPNNYLNQYTCTTNQIAGSTCSLTVSDYAGNLATFTTSGNPFGICPPHQILNAVTHTCHDCPPNTIPNSNQTACITPPVAPTPTPTPAPGSTPAPESTPKPAAPPVCGKPAPTAPAPLITKAERVGKNSIRLFFNPAGSPVTGYVVSYGYQQPDGNHQFSFGTTVNGSNPGSVLIASLNLNATYVFKVMPVNDCATGNWSNVFPVTIKPLDNNYQPAHTIPSSSAIKPAPTPTPTPTPSAAPQPAITSNVLTPTEEIKEEEVADYSPFLLLLSLLGLLLPSGVGLVLSQDNRSPLEAIKLTLTGNGQQIGRRRTNRFGAYDSFRLKPGKYTLSLHHLAEPAGGSAIMQRVYQSRAGFLHPFAPIMVLPLSAPKTNWRVKLIVYWCYFTRALAYLLPYSLLASIIWVSFAPSWLAFSVLATNIIWLLKVIYKAGR